MTSTNSEAVKSSALEDIVGVLYQPSTVFDRRRDGKYGKILIYMGVFTLVIMLATMGLNKPFWDAQSLSAVIRSGGTITEESRRILTSPYVQLSGIAFSVVMVFVGSFIAGAFLLLSTKIAGVVLSFSQAVLVSALASVPKLFVPVAMAIQSLVIDHQSITGVNSGALGPSRFFSIIDTAPSTMALLGQLDLLNGIWPLLLVGIGVKVIGRVTFSQAAVVAAIYLGISLAFALSFMVLL